MIRGIFKLLNELSGKYSSNKPEIFSRLTKPDQDIAGLKNFKKLMSEIISRVRFGKYPAAKNAPAIAPALVPEIISGLIFCS